MTTPGERGSSPPLPPTGGAAGGAKLAVGVLAVAALALAGLAVADLLEDEPLSSEPALPPLPTPAPPRERPMVSVGTGQGWTWVNPQPRAMPTWYAVAAVDAGERVALVGAEGQAVRYDRGSLFVWPTGLEVDLRGVAWMGAREALAVGDGGALVRLHDDGHDALASGVEVALRGVVATSPTEAVVVGDAGTVLRVAGDRVTAVDVGSEVDLLAAHADGARVFAVGGAGTVLRLEGRTVTRESVGVQSLLRAIGGCPGGEIYAAGEAGVLLRRRTTGQWSRLRVSGTETFTGVACDHGRVAVTRADGELWLVSGATTLRLPTGFERAWHAVSGAAEGPSWLVGMGGRLATIEADHVRTRTAGPTVPIRDLGAMGGALVAVGEWGRILREQESGLVEVSSPTEAGLAALVPIGEGRLLAVGDFGAAVDIRFDRATLLATPTQLSLRDAVYEDEDLLVVGAEGTLLRGTLDALTRSVVPDAGDLWAVDGTPEAALVVGDGGLVLRVTPSGFTRVPCAIGGVGLRDVARTPAGTFAVGEEGVVVRIEEAGCVEERRGGPTLLAIGVGPEGRPLAGGDGGVVVERTEEGTWTPVAIDVAGVSIRVIWRTSRDVYLAGTGGALIRHIALDGP